MKISCLSGAMKLLVAVFSTQASTTIDWLGSYRAESSAWSVTVREKEAATFGYDRKNGLATAISPSKWRPHPGWFVFIENELNLWAFDGTDYLLFVQISDQGGTVPLSTSRTIGE